jgi:hypothetical protein
MLVLYSISSVHEFLVEPFSDSSTACLRQYKYAYHVYVYREMYMLKPLLFNHDASLSIFQTVFFNFLLFFYSSSQILKSDVGGKECSSFPSNE